MPSRTRRPVVVALAGICVAGLALRLLGIGYGLPAIFNPDEVAIMNRALGFARGDLNPGNFLYPTLYFYVLFAWEGLFFLAARLVGVFDSLAAFERSFFVDPSLIYLAGRVLTSLFGVLTIVATWRLGAKLFGQAAGLVAALLLAVAPLAVIDAHYVKHDVPVTLPVVLLHVVLVDLVLDTARRRQRWRWIAAGTIAGVAMSTHYYAIFLVLPLTLAALLPIEPAEKWSTRLKWLMLAGVASVVAFFAGSPFLLVEPATAVRDIIANREIVMDRVTSATGMFGSLGFYAGWLANGAAGPLTFVAAAAGVIVTVAAGWRTSLLLLTFPLAFVLFISNTFPATRYLNPIVPFVALLAGSAFAWLSRRGRTGSLAAAALVIAAVTLAATASIRADLFFRQEDTRAQAQRWIEREVPPGASVLVQPYSVVLRPSRASLVEAFEATLGSASRASIKFQRMLALDPYPAPSYRVLYLGAGGLDADKIYIPPSAFTDGGGLGPLHALGIDYLVLKRFEAPDPSLAALDAALAKEARRVAAFSPYRPAVAQPGTPPIPPFVHNAGVRIDPALERPGPIVEVWKIR